MFRPMLVFASLLLPLAADGAEEKKATAQQQKMSVCNAQSKAKGLSGEERKKFMSSCLKASTSATQQDKMKMCNADAAAKKLKGDERKAFMSLCLKA